MSSRSALAERGVVTPARHRPRARSPRTAKSLGPMRQRGPLSSWTTCGLAVMSSISVRVATMSAISGTSRSPPSPTISTGTSRSVSALNKAPMGAFALVSTAISDHDGTTCCCLATTTWSAIQSISSGQESKAATQT